MRWTLRTMLIACVMLSGREASADTVTLNASYDNSMYEESPDNANGSGSGLFAGARRDGGFWRRALLRFDTSSLPHGSVVSSAALTMYVSRSSSSLGPAPAQLHRVLGAWGEAASVGSGAGGPAAPGDATWTSRIYPDVLWATPGGDFVAQPSASTDVGAAGQFYSWSSPGMAADAQGWVDSPGTNFGWVLRGDETHIRTAVRYDSRESPTPSQRPKLTIVYALPLGACCTGSACVVTTETLCAGLGRYSGTGTACNPPGVATAPCCRADFDQDGTVSLQDIFGFLGGWFAGDARADFTADGFLSLPDIFDFLAAWFDGC